MIPLGPSDPARSVPADRLLPLARAAAEAAGVTRLADVTRLDRIGLPVWQAVRPMSRALSVHQGKGATDADAQLGALLEAVESHSAETFSSDGMDCSFDSLPERNRPPSLGDFAVSRDRPPDDRETVRWVECENLLGGEPIYLPFDLISLDFTRNVPSLFDRASNGVATAATRDEAIAAALQELIERDSVIEWQAAGLLAAMESTVDLDSVPFAWLRLLRERIAATGAFVRCYYVPSITGSPVFACEINDLAKDGRAYRAIQGRGCHPLPEIALFKALAEAIQGRATYIAGARDDLMPSDYVANDSAIQIAFGFPLPPDMEGVDFAEIASGPSGAAELAAALEVAGYDQIAVIDLAQPTGLNVVRAFVCGLGSLVRRRRPIPS
ncbi:MAG TPA: YcaO-like family protein [Allosphingosinicella sp.]|nr:YcaO-like family protein [Allosphingosinicella sp.]